MDGINVPKFGSKATKYFPVIAKKKGTQAKMKCQFSLNSHLVLT